MTPSSKLISAAAQAARLRTASTTATARLRSTIVDIEKDGMLNDAQKAYAIAEARKKALPEIVRLTNEIQAIATEVRGQEKYWDNGDFVLAQATFSDAPSIHSAVASQKAAELQHANGPLLALMFQDAKDTKNFALLRLCLTERARRKAAGATDDQIGGAEAFSMVGVELPGQAEALVSLRQIDADRVLAEGMFSEASGTRVDGAARLVHARVQQGSDRMTKEAASAATSSS